MITEALSPPVENTIPSANNFSSFFSEKSALNIETASVIDAVDKVIVQYQDEGDIMFVNPDAKVECYIGLRDMTRKIPHYTGAIDVRDKSAIPNTQSCSLDHAFATLHGLWRNDPHIRSLLEKESEQFELKYREWYGTLTQPGQRDAFLAKLGCDSEINGVQLSEGQIEAFEMRARRAYCLPTITTALASDPV